MFQVFLKFLMLTENVGCNSGWLDMYYVSCFVIAGILLIFSLPYTPDVASHYITGQTLAHQQIIQFHGFQV